jgi:hypothetical protein
MVASVKNDVLTIPSIKERMSGIRKNGRTLALFANIASPVNFFTTPARSSMSVADEFAFSILTLPAFTAEIFAKRAASQTMSSDITTTDFHRDDAQVCFVPILL